MSWVIFKKVQSEAIIDVLFKVKTKQMNGKRPIPASLYKGH